MAFLHILLHFAIPGISSGGDGFLLALPGIQTLERGHGLSTGIAWQIVPCGEELVV